MSTMIAPWRSLSHMSRPNPKSRKRRGSPGGPPPPRGSHGSPGVRVPVLNAVAAVVGVMAPAVVVVLSSAAGADARSLCCCDLDPPMVQGAELGVWFLLGVTVLVQLAFGCFFLNLRQRLRLVRDPLPRPVFRLIKGGAPADAQTAVTMHPGRDGGARATGNKQHASERTSRGSSTRRPIRDRRRSGDPAAPLDGS